jgi:hypothetical protein
VAVVSPFEELSLRSETSYTTNIYELASTSRKPEKRAFFHFLDIVFQAVVSPTQRVVLQVKLRRQFISDCG